MNKQIEEMAKCMANCENTCDECFEQLESVMTMKIKDREQHCQAYMFAKRAVEQGYQKVDKDKQVVLTREEYEILLSNADSAFQDGLNESRDLYKQEVKEEVRKETATEIFKALYSMRDVYAEHYEYEIRLNEYNLQELAKQFGVEVDSE